MEKLYLTLKETGLGWSIKIMYLDSRDLKTCGTLETLVKNRLPPRGNQNPIKSFISKSNCLRSNLNNQSSSMKFAVFDDKIAIQ